jgi:thiamine biosynthesis lipoprotein ApbE
MRLAFLVAITLVASACASADQSATPVGVTGVDEAKMQAVEQAAERNGVRVYWMNPPRKPAASTDK